MSVLKETTRSLIGRVYSSFPLWSLLKTSVNKFIVSPSDIFINSICIELVERGVLSSGGSVLGEGGFYYIYHINNLEEWYSSISEED